MALQNGADEYYGERSGKKLLQIKSFMRNLLKDDNWEKFQKYFSEAGWGEKDNHRSGDGNNFMLEITVAQLLLTNPNIKH